MPIREHEEIISNFQQLLELSKMTFLSLRNVWGAQVANGYLTIFKMKLLASAVLGTVVNEIKKSKFFAILLDEASDIN